jgi:hypothetical protein
VRVKLIRDLAKGEHRDAELGRRYGVDRSAILLFKRRHSARIDEVRRNMDDLFAGIELADKVARVALLNDRVLEAAELLSDADSSLKAGVARAEMERIIQSGARAIAEELGQLPSRMQVQVGGSLDVQVNGIDVSSLQ